MKICRNLLSVTFLTLGFIFFYAFNIYSQEFNYEIGGMAGTSHYMGDANKSKPFLNPGFATGAVFRYNISFRWALKANLLMGNVSGKTDSSVFPIDQDLSFNRGFYDMGTQLEFNLLPYSDMYEYIGTRHYTPYLFTGVGLTYANGENNFLNVNMPLGVGFKYKLKNRVNIGIEFSMRKLFADDFDVTHNEPGFNLNEPYGIKSSILKNQDWYSLILIFLTWEFNKKEDTC